MNYNNLNVIKKDFTVLKLHSKNVILEILPEKGARISRYSLKNRNNTFDLLRPLNTKFRINKDSLLKTSFPLVPFSNRINNGKFTFQGKQIKLPLNFYPEPHAIHGHGWEREWKVCKVNENYALLEYDYFPDEWPFQYFARQIFELDGSNLRITIQIKNTGKTPMPAGLGFHPYFIRTPNSFIKAETKKMWVNDSKKIPHQLKIVPEIELLSKGLHINKFELDNIFTGWDHKAKITWPEWNLNLFIETKTPVDYILIYSPRGEDFFCLEPISHITNSFNMIDENIKSHGTLVLNPDQTLEGQVLFKPKIN